MLRTAWRRGGAWDESRADPEVARVSLVERASTAAPVLRALCLDDAQEFGVLARVDDTLVLARRRSGPAPGLRQVDDEIAFAQLQEAVDRATGRALCGTREFRTMKQLGGADENDPVAAGC